MCWRCVAIGVASVLGAGHAELRASIFVARTLEGVCVAALTGSSVRDRACDFARFSFG